MKKIFLVFMSVFVLIMPLSVFAEENNVDIVNLTSVYKDDTVSLKWENPAGVESISLYREGVLLTILDKDANYYHDTDIKKDKTYSYKVTVDVDGVESNGLSTTIKVVAGSMGKTKVVDEENTVEEEKTVEEEEETDPEESSPINEETGLLSDEELKDIDYSLLFPNNVVFLKAEKITADSVRLIWDNPVEPDLANIKVYQDGELIKTLPLTSEFTVKDLTPNTDYVFGVSVVDIDENESTKMSLNVATILGADVSPPATVKGVAVVPSNTSLYVKWLSNKEPDLAGYNVYLNGVKSNSTPINNLFYSISALENDTNYDVSVTAVDLTGNESEVVSSYGVPLSEPMPVIGTDYTLTDVTVGVETWFSQYWLIIAFAISVPLTFYIAARTKLLFLD